MNTPAAGQPVRTTPRVSGQYGVIPGSTERADPCTMVIFGATGDLTKRKLLPALWSLYASRTLPEPFTILGVSRTAMTDEEFRTRAHGRACGSSRFSTRPLLARCRTIGSNTLGGTAR